jgi:hypothetical protein
MQGDFYSKVLLTILANQRIMLISFENRILVSNLKFVQGN